MATKQLRGIFEGEISHAVKLFQKGEYWGWCAVGVRAIHVFVAFLMVMTLIIFRKDSIEWQEVHTIPGKIFGSQRFREMWLIFLVTLTLGNLVYHMYRLFLSKGWVCPG